MNLEELTKRPRAGYMGAVFYPTLTAQEYVENWHSPFCPVAEANGLLDLGMAIRGLRAMTLLVSKMKGISEGEVIGLLVKEAFEHTPKDGIFIGMRPDRPPAEGDIPPRTPGSGG